MNKTYKKLDIDKYIIENKNLNVVEEKDLNELVDTAGAMIDRNDNYKATPSLIKSKKTSVMISFVRLLKVRKHILSMVDPIMG